MDPHSQQSFPVEQVSSDTSVVQSPFIQKSNGILIPKFIIYLGLILFFGLLSLNIYLSIKHFFPNFSGGNNSGKLAPPVDPTSDEVRAFGYAYGFMSELEELKTIDQRTEIITKLKDSSIPNFVINPGTKFLFWDQGVFTQTTRESLKAGQQIRLNLTFDPILNSWYLNEVYIYKSPPPPKSTL